MKSTDLRATIQALDEAAAMAANQLTQADAAYRDALRASIVATNSNNPFMAAMTTSMETEAALADARTDHARALASLDAARQILAEALDAEAAAAQAIAREDILARLDEIDALARDADADFARFIGRVQRMRTLEIELRGFTRKTHRDPAGGIAAFSSLKAIGAYLGTLANGITPDIEAFAARAARSIRKSVEGAL